MKLGVKTLCLIAVLATAWMSMQANARVLHKERSLYQTILIVQNGRERCMQFNVRRDQRNQTCMDTSDPERMVFTYTRMMMAALLFVPEPQRVLVVGLGGGTLPTALHQLYPNATIDAVEIDPAVVKMAEDYFGFQANDRVRVHVQDARVFTKRARLKNQRYDLVLLDAYNGEYIPEHLMTQEYLEESKALLSPRGVLAANTFAVSALYDHESVTYERVFGTFINFRQWRSANRVIIARPAGLPDAQLLAERAKALAPRLTRYGIALQKDLKHLNVKVDWNPNVRPLTDQYAPANLLNRQGD